MASEPQQQLAPRDERSRYQDFVDRMTTQVIAALPLTVPDEDLKRARAKFRVAFSADAQGALQECSPESVARAIVMSAMSGLYPGGPRPDVWLVPKRNKHKGNVLEVNWWISFRGNVRLARRAGWELAPVPVFAGEVFEITEGSEPSIKHIRNLELPQTWEALRYAYIRVFPTGRRDQARIAYLSKDEIKARRDKAETQNIWNAWPLEMVYKTMCQYAGARELFPTDDPARYAIQHSEQSEIGSGAAPVEVWGSQAPGLRTAGLAARLAAKPAGASIDVAAAAPVEEVRAAPISEGLPLGVVTADGERLSPPVVAELRDLMARAGVRVEDLEERYGCSLSDISLAGVSAKELEAELIREIRQMAADAKAKGAEEQLPLGAG